MYLMEVQKELQACSTSDAGTGGTSASVAAKPTAFFGFFPSDAGASDVPVSRQQRLRVAFLLFTTNGLRCIGTGASNAICFTFLGLAFGYSTQCSRLRSACLLRFSGSSKALQVVRGHHRLQRRCQGSIFLPFFCCRLLLIGFISISINNRSLPC